MPATPKKSAKKTLLSQVGKKARDEIAKIMESRDGSLSLHEFMKKRWSWYDISNDEKISKRQDERRAKLAKLHTTWSPDEIDTTLRLYQCSMDLKDVAISRRVALDDPGELGRGLAVLNRFHEISNTIDRGIVEDGVLDICASGDLLLARRLLEGRIFARRAVVSGERLHNDVIYGLLQNDSETVRRLIPLFSVQKNVRPWLEGIYIALRGGVDNRADDVARGLELHMSGIHKMQQKSELMGAVNLAAQGLYRLIEWMSPDLVSQFDVTRPFPWDAEFHAWTSNNPHPLAELDFTDISPVLHDFLVLGKVPQWMIVPPQPLYELVLLGGDPNSKELLNEVERNGGGNGSLKSAKALLANAPCSLQWGIPKDQLDYFERCREYLEKAGAQAEIREMTTRDFRFLTPHVE